MSFHGNLKKNPKLHHLYLVHDTEENDIFKYGISDKPVGDDGYSKRMREQVDYLNRAVGWARYFAIILILDIPGRARARRKLKMSISMLTERNMEGRRVAT
jgi:hypothetical protein